MECPRIIKFHLLDRLEDWTSLMPKFVLNFLSISWTTRSSLFKKLSELCILLLGWAERSNVNYMFSYLILVGSYDCKIIYIQRRYLFRRSLPSYNPYIFHAAPALPVCGVSRKFMYKHRCNYYDCYWFEPDEACERCLRARRILSLMLIRYFVANL